MSQKRKGDEVITPMTPSVVVGRHPSKRSSEAVNMFTPRQPGPLETLQALKATWVGQERDQDPFVSAVYGIDTSTTLEQAELQKSAHQIQSSLQQQIEKEETVAKAESHDLNSLEQSLQDMYHKKSALQEEIFHMTSYKEQLQARIARYHQDASDEIESMDQFEEERKLQVPRLRTQLSLYASTTGVKWEYSSPNILSGHLAVPLVHGFKKFSFDIRDYSAFEIANQLWTLMDGTEE